MENNKGINKKSIYILIGVSLAALLLMGLTYAWLTQVLNGTKINRITVAGLNLILDDNTSNGINIENGLPQTDEQGIENDQYRFSVNNGGSVSAEYRLFLEDEEIEGERIADSNIKYNLKRNGTTIKEGLLTTSVTANGKRELESTVIRDGDTNNYSLVLWIDQESTQSEVANKTFKAKIVLEAVQAQDISEINLGEDVTIDAEETHTFNATITPELSDTSKIKWCSSSNTVISGTTSQGRCDDEEYEISSCYGHTSCEVEGTSGGEATITVRSGNISDSATLIVNSKIVYLYEDGNQYADITGGWLYTNDIEGAISTSASGNSINIVNSGKKMHYMINAGRSTMANSVNLTGKTKLKVDIEFNVSGAASSDHSMMCVVIAPEQMTTSYQTCRGADSCANYLHYADIRATSTSYSGTIEYPISENGYRYIYIAASQPSTTGISDGVVWNNEIKIKKVWLE